MKIEYWMKLPDVGSRKVADNFGIFNSDSIRNNFSSSYSKIENVEVYVDSIDTTTHAIVEFTFNRIDLLNQTKMFADSKFQFKEETSGQIVFSQFIAPIAIGFGIDANEYSVSYSYTFSGTILNHNAHQVKDNILVWNYSLADIGVGKSIAVTFRPFKLEKTPDWIYMLTGAVLALVIFFLLRRKKG
ncbi:MAG: hypothetical protein JSW63_02560 [Ignavibacterium sp.]|nr:MAG: hypothetical protein JSW63_02560 [Ignavibacterium sp.]